MNELIAELKKYNPSVQFAVSGNGNGIAIFDKNLRQYVSVIEKAITGQWVYTGGNMPLVNGKQIERNWTQV